MNIFEDTNPHPLRDLLSEINSRTMVLPDFQRDFVWDPAATQELIVSIANNYPAGSLLRVRDSKRVFAAREFEGAPPLNGKKHTFLVLDGQQRLTSLYQAFFGVGEHRYFLDLKKLIDGKDFEEAIFHLRAKPARGYEDFENQKADLILPLSTLKSGSGGFLEWMLEVSDAYPSEKRNELRDALKAVNSSWIKSINDYQFPVVTLSEKTEADALCTIFETLNRTGVKLSVFELLTARFWPQNINLRSLWCEIEEKRPIVTEYDVDPYYFLQAISLVSRRAPSCKKKDVLDLKGNDIKKWWPSIASAYVTALEILRDDCSVITPKWLPYNTMLVTAAAIVAKVGLNKGAKAAVLRERLVRWFWCSVFAQMYDNAANSQSAKDFSEVVAWIGGGPEPESISNFKFDPAVLRDTTPRQRATYRGVICLVLNRGNARDFHTKSVITAAMMKQQGIDDHHIFPADYLQKKAKLSDSKLRDCVLNRTLIDRTTNQMISNRAPSDYIGELQKTKDFPFPQIFKSHLLPINIDSPLIEDNFEDFLTWRQNEIWKQIKEVTGLSESKGQAKATGK
jgi:hypothetical protein